MHWRLVGTIGREHLKIWEAKDHDGAFVYHVGDKPSGGYYSLASILKLKGF